VTVEPQAPSFRELGLSEPILEALAAVGYETPSPIQAQTIPVLLAGSDMVGQAQTGTGKTAAFALPLLAQIQLKQMEPQALVLVPTRELAIQVAEAFQKYAAQLRGFHVLPIYGGQSYTPQLKGLKRGAHVIVGTPGRVMDHIKSGALDLSSLRHLVLDEGDEMLQMGFVDDIEWILEQTPPERQIALFSATMPPAIRRIAEKHMRDAKTITIQNRAATAPKIRQRCWMVSGLHKLDALTRMLEVETFDAMLVFVRTKIETVDLAERLEARGFRAAPLNGDIQQQQREKTITRLKNGQLDIVVATDVAARGIDVNRISHVVNYDIPYDSETYVHRIGRTGRAGRSGEAILFVSPRERNMLRIIERVTNQRIEPMTLPTISDVNEHRIVKFKERVLAAAQSDQGKVFLELLRQMEAEQNVPAIEIAAGLAGLLQGDTPFLLPLKTGRDESGKQGTWGRERSDERSERPARAERPERSDRPAAAAPAVRASGNVAANEENAEQPAAADATEMGEPSAGDAFDIEAQRDADDAPRERGPRRKSEDGVAMETFRIEVGHAHGVLPGNIVGAIANEAGLDGKHIGHIDIRDDHTFVDLPEGMPKEIFRELKKVKVRGVEMRIAKVDSKPPRPEYTGHSVRPRREDRRPAGRTDEGAAPAAGGETPRPSGNFKHKDYRAAGPRGPGAGFRAGKPHGIRPGKPSHGKFKARKPNAG
jgi:ATP-dependent RNA helicase DeaD